MKMYIETKVVTAKPMTRQEYCDYLGWVLPEGEAGSTEGYLTEFIDGLGNNHLESKDYITWSPKARFEKTSRAINHGMTFGQAIEAAKIGHKIARMKWNGKNMFVVFMSGMTLPPFNTQGTERKVNDRTAKWIGEDKPLNSQPYFAMYNAQEEWIPGWLASQSDMLDTDWYVVE